MRPPSTAGKDRTLRFLGQLSIVVTAALLALMLYAGDLQSVIWWLIAIPFSFWIIGPTVLPWLIARLRGRPGVTLTMLVFLIASSALSAIAYYDAFFRSTSSTAALVLVFLPLWQWIALAIVAIIAITASARA